MTNSQFIREVASHMDVSIPEAKIWVSVIFDTLTDKIMSEDKVIILNFGTFKRKIRKPRRRGDINTGQVVTDPAKTVASFDPSGYLEYKVVEEAPLEE